MEVVRAAIRQLPPPVIRTLKYIALLFEPLLNRVGLEYRRMPTDRRDPFFGVDTGALRSIELEVLADRPRLLQIDKVRQMLADQRMRQSLSGQEVARVAEEVGDIAHNSLGYNLESLKTSAGLDRPMVMIKVVSAIQRVSNRIEQLDVLSIGPRSEIEIFAIMSAGFDRNRIRAIDLFSYSPYVDVGDAHHMPYPDNSFDILFLGWVLPYSRTQANLAQEIVRVCRNGAIVAVASDYSDPSLQQPKFRNEATAVTSVDAVLGLFSGSVGTVYYRHDPSPPETMMIMTVFEVSKH